MPLLTDEEFNQAMGAASAQQQQAQSATILQGVRTPPQMAAKAINVGTNLGLPPGFVLMDPEQNDLLSKAKTMRDGVADNPALARWVAEHPINASLAQNDVPALGGMEKTLASRTDNPILGALLNTSDWLGKTGSTIQNALGEGLHSTAQAGSLVLGAFPVMGDKLRGDTTMSDWWFKNMVDPHTQAIEADQKQQAGGSFDQKLIGSISKLGLTLGEIALTGGASAETQLATKVPGALSMLGAATEHAIKSMWFPATMDAVNTGHRVYEATNGDGAAAFKAAETQYVATTGMGLVPLSAPGGLATRAVTGFGTGMLSGEVSRQGMNAVLPDTMRTPFSWEETFLSGVSGSLLGATMGPRSQAARPGMSSHLSDAATADQAISDHTAFDAAAKLAANTEMRTHAPEQFKELAQRFTENGHITDVYVEADAFAQALDKAGITAEQLTTMLPELAQQMKPALETNGTVRIAPEDYFTHIAGGKLDDVLRQELRLNEPDAPTLREATEFYQNHAEQMKKTASDLVTDKAEQDQFRESQDALQRKIHGQLDALGRTPTSVNKVYAGINTALLSRIAAHEGITPEQAHEKYGATVVGESGGKVLEQVNPDEWAKAEAESKDRTVLAEKLSAGKDHIEFKHPDGKRYAIAGRDASVPGGWRITRFDEKGPVGHGERATLADAAQTALEEGYKPSATRGGAQSLDDVKSAWNEAGVSHTLSESGDTITLSKIVVPKESQGQGIGTKALRELIDYADNAGKRIVLTPSADFGGTKSRLEKLYKSLGFVENKGKNKDFTTQERMIREPHAFQQESGRTETDGPFGPITDQFKGDAEGAIAHLKEQQSGEAIGALTHPELGDIDLVWGKEGTGSSDGYGLAKLLKYHPEVVDNLQNILSSMKVVSKNENRAVLESEDHKASVRLSWDGQAKKWLLTAFEKRDGASTRTDTAGLTDEGDTARPTAGSEISIAQDLKDFYQNAKGSFNPATNTIALLKTADLSTYLHETGHWALDTYAKIALRDDAPPAIKAEMDNILKWFGVESLDKWHDMSLDEQRPHHEQFARGFETYLMEGKAPSQELQPFFARIRSWMVDIYREIRNLNVELTPEVRGVFDRLLASEDAIQQAQSARVFEPIFKSKPEGMTDAEYHDYLHMGSLATSEAIDDMQARSMRDMKWLSGAKSRALRDLQRQAKEARATIEDQVTKEVEQMPIYAADLYLKRLGGKDPAVREQTEAWKTKRDAQAATMADQVKADFLAKPEAQNLKGIEKGQYLARVKRDMANETERRMLEWEKTNRRPEIPDAGIDVIAEMFGFDDAKALRKAQRDAGSMKDTIEGLTDKRMLEEHGELNDPRAIEDAANQAVHNETRARFMATGLKVLAKSPIPVRELMRAADEAANSHIASLKVKEVNPRQYLSAETRANKDVIKLAPKDPQGAIKAQREALLNNRLVKSAYDAQKLVADALRYAKSFDKTAKRAKLDLDVRDQIDALLERFDFRQIPTDVNAKQREQLSQWMESQKALGYTPIEVGDMLDPSVRMHYKEMSVEQLRGLMDTVKSLEKIGRDRKKITLQGARVDVDEAVRPMIDNFKERGEKFTDAQLAERPRYGVDPVWRVALDRIASWMRTGRSELLRPDYKGNKYDLHELLGPFQQAFSERLFKASYDFGDFMDSIGKIKDAGREKYALDKAWQESLTTVVGNHNLMDNSLAQPVKRRLTRGDLIGMAMHVGNESNFDKLVKGMRWEAQDIWRTLHDNMSEKDWGAARTLGEMAGAKWDEMSAMNRRLGNDMPVKIEPRPFKTKFGEMPGWYAPVDYDPLRSRLGKRKAEEKAINPADGVFGRDYFRADTTTNGSLNARASGYYDYINLDFHPLEKRISDTLRDLAYREALLDVHKVYSHKEFSQQFARTFGPEEYRHLGDWLGRLTNAEVNDGEQTALKSILATSRRALVANGVAFRISTMLKHGGSAAFKSTGYFAGGGEKYFAQRIATMSVNYRTQVDEALAKFPEIRQRMRQQDRDFGIAVNSILEPETLYGKAERFGHAGVAWMDFFTAVPTAHAAYDWAITEGIPERLGGTGKPMSEAEAIQFASKVVREAHGSTNEASQSLLISNRSEMMKTLTTLHGFMNNAFGQNADSIDKVLHANGFGKPELLARTFMAQLVPAIMAGWVTFGGPKDEESPLGWFFHHIAGEFAGMLPMVREGWSAVVEGHASAGLPPWIRALTEGFVAAKSVVKGANGDPVKHPIKDVGNAAGLLLPGLGQGGSTAQFLYDVGNKRQEPETVGEWIRGVMTGQAKHK